MQLTLYGTSIHYAKEEYYPGRPYLVFLHDSLGCVETWRTFPEVLAKATQCNFFIYDRHGYGLSDPFLLPFRDNDYLLKEAHILYDILRALEIRQPILFGHSDGGSIALLTAALFPFEVRAIITEGAHIFVEDITLNGIREAKHAYQNTNLKDKLQKYHGEKTDALFKAWVDTWLSSTYATWRIDQYLPEIACPALIIQGNEDQYGSAHQVEGIISQSGGMTISRFVKDCGHSPHKEATDVVLQHCQSFISSLIKNES